MDGSRVHYGHRAVAEQHSAVKNAAWMRNPVNAFITAELDKQKLAALPDVDRQTLLRRVYLIPGRNRLEIDPGTP